MRDSKSSNSFLKKKKIQDYSLETITERSDMAANDGNVFLDCLQRKYAKK